jgi:hypothetical protein
LEGAQPRVKISLLLLKNGSMAAINSSTEPFVTAVRFVPFPLDYPCMFHVEGLLSKEQIPWTSPRMVKKSFQ